MPNRIRIVFRERDGVALPLALIGLVAVSLMITAALITSSTELALSSAHRDGVQALYNADAALEGYVGERALRAQSAPFVSMVAGVGSFTVAGQPFQMTTTRLRHSVLPPQNGTGTVVETFSILAEPASGRGRSVGALLDVTRTYGHITANIDAGAVFGGGVTINGSSKVTAYTDMCAANTSTNAVRFTNDVAASEKNISSSNIEGDTATYTGISSDSLVRHILGGATLDQLAKHATIKFGYEGKPNFDKNRRASALLHPDTSAYNWGCPQGMEDACLTDPDTARFPIISVDATNLGSKTVVLSGNHGQGILLVRNGDLKLTGTFLFKGIVLVDGSIYIEGGAGGASNESKIEGSVVATGGLKDSRLNGNAVIKQNQCAIADAQKHANDSAVQNAAQIFSARPRAWYEVVR